MASCQAVIPSACRWRWPRRSACLEVGRRVVGQQPRDEVHGALVERAARGCRPRRVRSGRRPGPASRRSRPASSSARLLTHAPWPSRLVRKTGRSGTMRSRSSRSGRAARERRPCTSRRRGSRPRPGCERGVCGDHRRARARLRVLVQVAAEHGQAAVDRMDVGILEAGRHGPAAQLDDPRRRPDVRPDGRVRRRPRRSGRRGRPARSPSVRAASIVAMRPPAGRGRRGGRRSSGSGGRLGAGVSHRRAAAAHPARAATATAARARR